MKNVVDYLVEFAVGCAPVLLASSVDEWSNGRLWDICASAYYYVLDYMLYIF